MLEFGKLSRKWETNKGSSEESLLTVNTKNNWRMTNSITNPTNNLATKHDPRPSVFHVPRALLPPSGLLRFACIFMHVSELIRVSTLNMRLGHDNRVSLQIE